MFVGWSVGWAVLWWFGFGVWLPLLFAFRDCFFLGWEVRLFQNYVKLFFVFLSALLFGFQAVGLWFVVFGCFGWAVLCFECVFGV